MICSKKNSNKIRENQRKRMAEQELDSAKDDAERLLNSIMPNNVDDPAVLQTENVAIKINKKKIIKIPQNIARFK